MTEFEDLRIALDCRLPDGSPADREQVSLAERRLDRRAVEAGQITPGCFRELWGVDWTEVEL